MNVVYELVTWRLKLVLKKWPANAEEKISVAYTHSMTMMSCQ